jgi:hypothetical protein
MGKRGVGEIFGRAKRKVEEEGHSLKCREGIISSSTHTHFGRGRHPPLLLLTFGPSQAKEEYI